MSTLTYDVPTTAFREGTAADPPDPRGTPADAFRLARLTYRRGERLDMAALAAELGVARTTLYRWTGDRERLISDVCWAELASAVALAEAAVPGHGEPALRALNVAIVQGLAASTELRAFLRNEGERGLQLLTAPDGGVRPRIVARIAARIQAEVDAGHYRAPERPEIMADAIVSLGERFLYHGGAPEQNPDPKTAARAIALLLREDAS